MSPWAQILPDTTEADFPCQAENSVPLAALGTEKERLQRSPKPVLNVGTRERLSQLLTPEDHPGAYAQHNDQAAGYAEGGPVVVGLGPNYAHRPVGRRHR